MTSYIYFIQAKGDGPIKIGFTGDDPRKRMVKIQCDCPWPVALIGAIEGTLAQEKQIHLLLSHWRKRGEWYDPHPIVLAAVREALKVGTALFIEEQETDKETDNPLKKWRIQQDLTQLELSEILGVSVMAVSRWERGLNFPHRRQWSAIEERTGIPADKLVEGVAQ